MLTLSTPRKVLFNLSLIVADIQIDFDFVKYKIANVNNLFTSTSIKSCLDPN